MAASPEFSAVLAARLATLRTRIEAAARRGGRDPAAITIVAVTKSAPTSVLPLLAPLGLRAAGESRVTALVERQDLHPELQWHLVGHLQSNKARPAVAAADVLHGVDSLDLLLRLQRLATELGRSPHIFLQVKLAGGAHRKGVTPEALGELVEAAASAAPLAVAGLMTLAPEGASPAEQRRVFGTLRRLAERHGARLPLPELSMGMSSDLEAAIEEGATLIRPGRMLFADLPDPAPPVRTAAGSKGAS